MGAAALLSACQPRTATPPPNEPSSAADPARANWDSLVEAARREGEVTLYSGVAIAREALVEAFETQYQGIKINGTYAQGGADIIQKTLTERSAGKYLPDVIVGLSSSAVTQLKPVGAVAPMEPALVLTEVTDLNGWFQNRFWWVDDTPPYSTFAFQGGVPAMVSYNTALADPAQFTSFWDLLDPRWRGRIISADIRGGGGGIAAKGFWYKHPTLGPGFLTRLFSETEIVVSRDHRQMVDWLAEGRYAIGLNLFSTEISRAIGQGLPVTVLPHERLKEGMYNQPGGGTVSLASDAPHPNASRVFVNWLLSRSGQLAWQNGTKEPSLRLDVPREGLRPSATPQPGLPYMDATTVAFLDFDSEAIDQLIGEAIDRGAR